MSGVGSEWPKVRADLGVLIERYRQLGPIGRLVMLQDLARRADEAWDSQDLERILPLFEEMREAE